MVDMGVCNNEKLNFIRMIDINIPVAPFNLRIALVHAAIHGKSVTLGFQNKARSGNGSGRPHKFYLHWFKFLHYRPYPR
jgi:hypothetical protein